MILTLETVVKAARKAYEEQRLTAQAADPRDRRCLYRKGEYCCAIGAALPDKVIDKLEANYTKDGERYNSQSIEVVVKEGFVDVENDLAAMKKLQAAHDHWCQTVCYKEEDSSAAPGQAAEAAFVELLDKYSEGAHDATF
jgi:uncharacterized Ntn-hydrolase superfamily protein